MTSEKSKIKMGSPKRVYNGIIFDILKRNVVFPNGDKKVFEYCKRPDSVTILAFDDKDNLLLIRERRGGFNHNVWFLPAGRVDKGETHLQAAKRELREEAGFAAEKFKLIYKKSPSSALVWNIHIFAAKDIYPNPLKGDEHFPIQVIPTPLKKAVQMALDGTIENEFIAYHIIKFDYMLKHGQFSWN